MDTRYDSRAVQALGHGNDVQSKHRVQQHRGRPPALACASRAARCSRNFLKPPT